METLEISLGKPTKDQLRRLERRCAQAFAKLKRAESEAKLPVFFEFAGSPKSGKTTCIGIVAHFLKRRNIRVVQPAEGASLRTPERLKDDWLAFNAWSGCYALQNILTDSFADPPVDVVLLDRGLFDIAGWMEFLCSYERRVTQADRDRVTDFFTLDLWRRRVNGVFLFVADHETSLGRETDSTLTTAPGTVMNPETLKALTEAYDRAASNLNDQFERLFRVDTSLRGSKALEFQMVAYSVAEKMVELLDDLGTQELLVTEEVRFEGFKTDANEIRRMCDTILRGGSPRFMHREEAEKSKELKQVVPYALVKDKSGRFFRARRRADTKRKELRRKLTVLVGGHAEKRDWDPANPGQVFETCLRRELDEELVGVRIESVRPLGFVFDPHTPVGHHHLAFIHEVTVGGKPLVRRQAIDKEFGREAIEWITADKICECIDELDPWSQLVAHRLFDAKLPPSGNLFPRRA